MADDRVVGEIVSELFLNTCQQRRRLNTDDVAYMKNSSFMATAIGWSDDIDIIPLSTGSVAEFYIEPMLSCIGDVDIMYHPSAQLAIPQGHPPPIQLPDEFRCLVHVFEIVDSEFPGYVHLVSSYLLTEITDDGKYNAVRWPHYYKVSLLGHGFTRKLFEFTKNQGPAFSRKESDKETPFFVSRGLLSMDAVPCVRCLSWPLQAADWPTQHRNYGWPDSATLDHVVSNGCDVVEVAHRLCRQDEWMSKYQHRLSFSRAEITLLNSWMKVQQIVYHMLRSFMKNEGLTDITDNTGSKILSNYNIKTLML